MKQRAGAPRLIDWTGERFVPWVDDAQLAYEHLHRYAWARAMVAGRRVLDLGCGEGFGASILADEASEVLGVDLDPDAVRHAGARYGSERVRFSVGDARSLDDIGDAAFDAVVAFEVVEHLREHERLMAAIRRVVRPGGLVLMSTPDRTLYRAGDEPNPFHRRELDRPEFADLLARTFTHVGLFAQRAHAGSRIDPLGGVADAGEQAVHFQRSGETWTEVDPSPPYYLLGVASDDPLPALPAGSTLVDVSLDIVGRAHQALAEERERRAELEARIEQEREDVRREAEQERERTGSRMERERALARERLERERGSARAQLERERASARERLERERRRFEERVAEAAAELEDARRRHEADMRAAVAARSERDRALVEEARDEGRRELARERSAREAAEELARRAVAQSGEARREAAALREELERVRREAGEAHALASRVSGSITWRAIERVRKHLYRPDGRPNPGGRLVSAGLRAAPAAGTGRGVAARAHPRAHLGRAARLGGHPGPRRGGAARALHARAGGHGRRGPLRGHRCRRRPGRRRRGGPPGARGRGEVPA